MKKILFASFLVCFFSALSMAQTDKQNMKVQTDSEPMYPKGDQALYTEILTTLHYPEEAVKKYVEGDITVSFDVKPDSTVNNILIIKGVGYGVDEELKKKLATLKFAPAVQNGMKVRMNTMYTFPVKAH